MDRKALDERFDFATSLIKEAGALALGHFSNRDALVIKSKGLQDMASQADMATEVLIRDSLRARFPDDGFLGEETGRDELGSAACIWVVDPIDGTQPFVHGLSSWCVSIGLLVDGAIEMGLVLAPARDELFTGRRGGAALLNGAPIRVANVDSLTQGMLSTGYNPRIPADVYLPMFGKVIRGGGVFHRDGSGALALAYVAAGRLIGYVEPHINSWDCLGALAVLEAAGGTFNDFLANDGLWKGNRLIAGPPGLYPKLEALFDRET
jgi:myo-inositol-1(or 4)-monophosphatase